MAVCLNLRRLFTSRYVLFLEEELAIIRKRHSEELERIKTLHAEEINRVICEANRGWAEADRLRLFVVPGLPASTRENYSAADSTPAKKETAEEDGGTPFVRAQRRNWEEQVAAAKEAERIKKAKQQFPTAPVAPA